MLEKVITTVVFIVLGVVSVVLINIIFNKILSRNDKIHLKFLKSFTSGLVTVIFTYIYLSQFDITKDIGKTLMQSGTLLIAIATFAAQRVLSNIISGIVIASTKPFDVGDKISLLDGATLVVTGVVIDINTRHTSVKTSDGKVALIANSLVDNYVCINENTLENNGYPLVLECSFDSDVTLAISIMQQEIDNHPLVINTGLNQATVTCSGVNPDGFELKAIVFTENIADNIKACSDLRVSIFKEWQKANIQIPYKTITVTGADSKAKSITSFRGS